MIEHCTILSELIRYTIYIYIELIHVYAIQKLSRVECALQTHQRTHTSYVPAMPKNLPPVRLNERSAAAKPAEKVPLSAAIKYTEESRPMRLDRATEYFSSSLPKEFIAIEGGYSPRESEGLAKGDVFIAYCKKAASFLKLKSGSACVTIPVVTRTEFALTPPGEEDNETDAAIRSWEGEFHSVSEFFEARRDQRTPMPAALKVLDEALDHKEQMVPAKTILFNIRQVNQRVGLRKRCGIEGVDSTGAVHRFLEGESPVYFSTKLFDVKCSPMCFMITDKNLLQFPQTARVYLHANAGEEEEKAVNVLQNLSTITITGVTHGHHLVVRKVTDRGDGLGPAFSVPGNADVKVVAIKLNSAHLLDSISDQQCVARAKSCPSTTATESQKDMNLYSNDPSEAARGDVQAGKKGDTDNDIYYNLQTTESRKYNSQTAASRKYHHYVNMQVAVGFVPAASDHCGGDTDLNDMTAMYEYISVTPQVKMYAHDCLPVACVESPEYTYVPVQPSGGGPSQGQPKGLTSPLQRHTKPKQHVPHPTQPAVLPRPQNTEKYEDAIYEEMEEDAFTQQRTVKSDHKLPQPQPSRPSPPVSPACSDLSTKTKPKGVPSTAIQLVPAVSTPTRHPPPVSKKPRMLTLCPKEPELRFHVAARLGLDWRSVCSYLGLQHYQLDQADEAHAKLEEKAMQALVMWLQGQGESRVPRSWSTLLRALRRAGHSDMASRVEKCIGDGTLQLS